jgi:predicted Zn-dependent protease
VDCDATVDSQCVANNYVHGVNFSSTLTGEWTDALEETIAYYNDNSELVVWGSAPYTTTNDVRAATVVTANGLWGWTRCVSTPTQTGTLLATPPPFAIDTKWCIPQLIYFNDQYEGYYNTLNRKTAVACHELGHTMGLRHRSTTPVACMRSTPINRSPEPDLVYPSPGGHDLNHLNAFYD